MIFVYSRMLYLRKYFILIFLGLYFSSFGQEKKASIRALPLAFYSPETSLGLGLAGVSTFALNRKDSLNSPSQVQLVAAYTFNRQLLLYAPFQFFSRKNSLHISGEIGYFNYTYFYFGQGPDEGLEENMESYQTKFPRLRLKGYQALGNNHFLGASLGGDYFDMVRFDSIEGNLFKENTYGIEGGGVYSMGICYKFDSRKQVYFPLKADLITLDLEHYFGDYSFQRFTSSWAHYQPLGKGIWASQLYYEQGIGTIPFFALPFLGGGKLFRAYTRKQVRSQAVAGIQQEYRSAPILFDRLRAVAFASYGYDWENSIQWNKPRWAIGTGLRFCLDTENQVFMRVDYGWSPQATGLYVTIGEAF